MINDLLAGVSSFQTNRRASSRFVAGQNRKLLQFVPKKVRHSTAEFFIKSPPSLTDIFINCSEEGGMPDEPNQKPHHCVHMLMHTGGWISIDCAGSFRTT
jgi:hypothetical protein